MAKVSTEKMRLDDDDKASIFKFDVNVSKDGIFSTTLPKDVVKILKDANVSVHKNQLGNEGYITSSTHSGLIQAVKDVLAEYKSRELICEKIVLRYVIQTQCSYAKDKEGNICPNPSKEWSGMEYGMHDFNNKNPENVWFEGNVTIDSTKNRPFGFLIYAKPFVKRDYQYKSGKQKTEYSSMGFGGDVAANALEKGYYLRWLNAVPCIAPPDGFRGLKGEEMDYTENLAKFFVEMIISICKLNDRIKDFLTPDKIKEIAENGQKLLE